MKITSGTLLFVLILFSVNVLAQPGSGKITGQVVDKAIQIPLPGVNILVEGTTLGAASDIQGHFVILQVPAGSHHLRFRMMGYKELVLPNVVVNPGRTTILQAELEATVLETEEIVVTAGYFQEARDAVVSNRSMDFEEIRGDPGSAEDVQRVVQALPAVVSGADQDNEIIVRGGMPGENLFVMDNIEIPNPNHFGIQGTTGGPINMMNTYFIRRVDFYAGAFPAKYGDKASSVMDISLRDGNSEQRTGHFYLGMSGAGLMAEGPFAGSRGSWIVSARKSYLDLVIRSTGLTAVPHYYNLQAKMTYEFSPAYKLLVNGLYGDDRITIEGEEGDESYTRGAENVRTHSYQYATGASLRRLWSNKGYSYLTLSQVGNYWNHYVYHSNGAVYYTNTSLEIERAVKFDHVWQVSKRHETSFGGQLKWVAFDHDIWMEADTTFFWDTSTEPDTILFPFRIFPGLNIERDIQSYKAAAYFQHKMVLLDRLTLTAGLRYDYFRYIRKGSLAPRLGLSFSLYPGSNLNFAYGDHYQSPTYVDLTSHPLNSDLNPKVTRQWILGLEHLFSEDMRGTLELYYKTYRRVAIPISWTTPDPYDYANGRLVDQGKGYAKGLELFLQKKMSRNFHFTVSYSHSIAQGFDPRLNQYFNWDYDFRDVFTFISGFRIKFHKKQWYVNLKEKLVYKILAWMLPLADEVDLSIRWRYLGGRPYTQLIYHPELHSWVEEADIPLNTLRFRPYHRLDLRLDRRFMFNGWNMVTYFDMMNVYDRDNIWGYSYKDDGSKEEILQWKVFPVGGIAIEF